MREKGIRVGGWRELRPIGSCMWTGLLASACAFLPACTSMVGPIPRVAAVRETDGFKMLRPGASATVCDTGPASDGHGMIAKAIDQLLAIDPEAESVIDVTVAVRRSPFGGTCATVRGDVVRATRTVVLPMPGHHQHHVPASCRSVFPHLWRAARVVKPLRPEEETTSLGYMTDNSTRLDHVVLWVRDPLAPRWLSRSPSRPGSAVGRCV